MPYRFERTTFIGSWCAAALVGIAISTVFFGISNIGWFILACVLIGLSFRRTKIALLFIIMSGLIIGAWRGTIEQQRLASLTKYIGNSVVVKGVVAADPENSTSSKQRIRIKDIYINGRSETGIIRVTLDSKHHVSRGDTIKLAGTLTKGFGSYQGSINFAHDIRIANANSPEIKIRDTFSESVKNVVPEPQSSLGLGFLLGQRSALPAELQENFQLLGLTHIVVASGYNLTILVRIARRFLERISKYQATTASLFMVAGFVTITGFSASMTRAAIVTCLAVWAWHYGRKVHPLVLILFAAAITALWSPFYVWSDVGWYLSFLAFGGVLMLAPLVTHRIYKGTTPALLPQIVIETICAQIATLPLILFLFGSLPLLSLPANILVVPFIPLAMLLTFIAGVVGFIGTFLGVFAGVPANLLLSYIVTLSQYLSDVSWASASLSFSLPAMIVGYLVIIMLGCILWYRTKYDFLQRSFIE